MQKPYLIVVSQFPEKPLRGSEIFFLAQRNTQTKEVAKIAEDAGADVSYIAQVSDLEEDQFAVWRKIRLLSLLLFGSEVMKGFNYRSFKAQATKAMCGPADLQRLHLAVAADKFQFGGR